MNSFLDEQMLISANMQSYVHGIGAVFVCGPVRVVLLLLDSMLVGVQVISNGTSMVPSLVMTLHSSWRTRHV